MNKIQAGLALLCLAAALPLQAQTRTWSGSARCDVTITGTGYSDRMTHTWQTTGGAPTQRGAFMIHAATWDVSGGGSFDKSTGDQTLHAQWTRNVAGMSAPIAVFTRASDGVVIVKPDHAQLRGVGAVSGSQEVRRGGQTSSTRIAAEAFEHAFPSIEGNGTSTRLSGQASDTPTGSFGFMQPASATVHVSCAWDFRRSDYAGNAPQNPATLPPPATPPTSTPPTSTPPATPPTTTPPVSPPTTTPPTSTPPPPGTGNVPVQTPPAVPTAAECAARLADTQASFDQQEAATEIEYSRLLAANAAELASLNEAYYDILADIRSYLVESNYTSTGGLSVASTDAAINRVKAERVTLETQKTNAIAAIRRNASLAASAIRLECGGATQGR